MADPLTLSLFPGVGLLDRGFEAEGFCVARGPDLLWGGDIRRFHPPPGKFFGVFGGSPCQDFSAARRAPPSGLGKELLREFARVVKEAQPDWWLLENVPRVPNVRIAGYQRQRIDINQGWYCGVSRLRHFQFGSRSGLALQIPRGKPVVGAEPAALACDGRSFAQLLRLMGLPSNFDLPGFTLAEKKRAVGNGVPLVMATVVARAILMAHGLTGRSYQVGTPDGATQYPSLIPTPTVERRRCRCGCGRDVRGRALYDSPACRKRAERARRTAGNLTGK